MVKEEIWKETKDHFELNEKENTTKICGIQWKQCLEGIYSIECIC